MRYALLLLPILVISITSYGRQHDTTAVPSLQAQEQMVSSRTLDKLNGEYASVDHSLERSSVNVLDQLQKQEAKLKAQLLKKDSTRAEQLFAGSEEMYAKLRAKLNAVQGTGTPVSSLNYYIPKLDSIGTAMRWLEGSATLQSFTTANAQQVQAIAGQVQQLQGKLQAAGDIQQYMRQREQQLKDQLASYGLGKQLVGINKTVYYYQQQVAQYKSMLNDRQKWQDAALSAIRRMPGVEGFMSKNSWLSQLFPAPPSAGTAAGLAGSQTASSVENEIRQRLGGQMQDPIGYMKQQVGSSQSAIDKVQTKLESLGSRAAGTDAVVPDFTPNSQKTKTFLHRLEFGFNIQTQKSSYLLPTTSALALTAGYRLSDKATMGVGASYNVGWGYTLNHIQVSGQGLSFRSFADIRAKGSFWITGSLEYNYLPALERISDLRSPDAWQKAGLIGVTKKYNIGKRSANLQLLYDLLSRDHVPQTQPLVFRAGYQL